MRNIFRAVFISVMMLAGLSPVFPIEITDYHYDLTNGIRIQVERGWKQTNASMEITSTNLFLSNRGAVMLDMKIIGDLIGNDPDISLYASGRMKTPVAKLTNGRLSAELPKGKYNAVFRLPLQYNNGMISFQVRDIPVKENSVSKVALKLNDIQVKVDESPADSGKLSVYRFVTYWAKGKNDGPGFTGYPAFFQSGAHDQMILPTETESDVSGKIRSGTYDLNLDTDISNARYRYTCWIERVKLEPGKSYTFHFNLNAAKIMSVITNGQPRSIGFYPAGTAKTQGLRENKKTVLYNVVNPWASTVCPTGVYDLLLNYNYGERLEWRENVEFRYGDITIIQ